MIQFSTSAVCAHGRRMDRGCQDCYVQIQRDDYLVMIGQPRSLPVVELTVEEINLNAGRIWTLNPFVERLSPEDKKYWREEHPASERPALKCPYCACIFGIYTDLGTDVWCPNCGEKFHLEGSPTNLPRGR